MENKIEVISKKTGEYLTIDIDTAIKEQENLIFLDSEYWQDLYEIWDKYQRPFIAESRENWFVLIYKDPNYQREKYEGNVYGRISKSISNLIKFDNSKEILFAWEKQWRFIALYP